MMNMSTNSKSSNYFNSLSKRVETNVNEEKDSSKSSTSTIDTYISLKPTKENDSKTEDNTNDDNDPIARATKNFNKSSFPFRKSGEKKPEETPEPVTLEKVEENPASPASMKSIKSKFGNF